MPSLFQVPKRLTLANKGSVARDHLANERTLLSWTRTSLTFLTFGVGFMQFFRLEQKTQCSDLAQPLPPSASLYDHDVTSSVIALCRPIGAMCVIMGILTLIFGGVRFFHVQSMLLNDQFPISRFAVVVLILINLAILILLLVLNFKLSL
ncbi:uncharacterized protein LODBEIA_P59870 [Lodderomyces beijingensis]|uniref:DUF202 domain-containing protein n=1 Tax=Lodderomyces beijingensis TaxID=1775926 RepID=A0ABP0ZVE6_9ASCO